MFFWILVLAAIAAVVVVIFLATSKENQCKPETTTTTDPLPKLGENLGSPLFLEDDGKKKIVSCLVAGTQVWVLTPYGPQLFTATKVSNPDAHLKNAEFEALAFYDVSYFSDSLAEKMGCGKGAWRIETILPVQTPAVPANDPRYEASNRHWLEDEYGFEDDFFDAMIFYYFLFDGFNQPYTYYDMYETPVYEDPVIEEPVIVEPPAEEDTGEFEAVPAEPTEETFEEGIGGEPIPEPEPESIPDPPPVPEPEPYTPPPAPEPEPYTPPAPEPYTPPESSGGGFGGGGGGGGGYDSGSSYDSGDSGGGGFDD